MPSPSPHREDGIRTVSSSTFTSLVLEGKGNIVVEFMSYGCAHCRVIEPLLQKVALKVTPEETIFRVNVAVEHELAARYEIGGTPTLVMFSHGREVGRTEGPRPTEASLLSAVTTPFAP